LNGTLDRLAPLCSMVDVNTQVIAKLAHEMYHQYWVLNANIDDVKVLTGIRPLLAKKVKKVDLT
jgi:hypothetical protein